MIINNCVVALFSPLSCKKKKKNCKSQKFRNYIKAAKKKKQKIIKNKKKKKKISPLIKKIIYDYIRPKLVCT